MDRATYLRHLADDGETMAAVVEAHPAEPVAACPGWTVAELVRHTGMIHRWAGETVRTGATERLSRRELPKPPAGDAEVAAWFRDGLASLLETLAGADPDQPVWTWGEPHSVAFWHRRMAQETAVHRWDCEAAAPETTPAPVEAGLAADGIDEILDVFGFGTRPAGGRLHLVATDVDRTWSVPVGDDAQEATARGDAERILLFLWGRIPPHDLDAEGDAELLARWQEDVRI